MSKSNKQGISLVEAIVSISIILIVIVAVGQIFPLALKVSRHAEQETTASNLAQSKIEEVFALGYENIAAGTFEAKHRLSPDPANPFYNYWRQTTISNINGTNLTPAATTTGLKMASTTVYWQSPVFKKEKSLKLIIMISQKN